MPLAKRPDNLLEVDSLVDVFLKQHEKGIETMHRLYFQSDDQLSLRALIAELTDALRTGCVTFLNKEYPMDEINQYLFYITNEFCKNKARAFTKKKTTYLCPGCLFLGKENTITLVNKNFRCEDCEHELKGATDPKKVLFFRTFFRHSKIGYHCQDCDRFIPHPSDDSPIVSCPYPDCCFVGSWSSLGRMHHPSAQSNAEMLTLDAAKDSGSTFKDMIVDDEIDAESRLEIQEELDSKVKLLRDVIDYQSNNVPYSSSDSTVKRKCSVYKAFDNILVKYPLEMVEYLLNNSRSGGFQSKIFQEYVRLLEEAIPFTFKKKNKLYKVESLLDSNLNVFEGISIFETTVNDRLTIHNNTTEFYIGGRKAKVTNPYYIGKLLNVVRKDTKESLLGDVTEYTFSLIKIKNVEPGTEVIVTHLRVPPHYQMGGMSHINRIRMKIIERANYLLQKDQT